MNFSASHISASSGLTSDVSSTILCFVNSEDKLLGFGQGGDDSVVQEYVSSLTESGFLKKAKNSSVSVKKMRKRIIRLNDRSSLSPNSSSLYQKASLRMSKIPNSSKKPKKYKNLCDSSILSSVF